MQIGIFWYIAAAASAGDLQDVGALQTAPTYVRSSDDNFSPIQTFQTLFKATAAPAAQVYSRSALYEQTTPEVLEINDTMAKVPAVDS